MAKRESKKVPETASAAGGACGGPHAAAAAREATARRHNPLPVYLGWVVLDEAGEKIAKVATRELAAEVALAHLLAHGLESVEMRERYFDVEGNALEGEPVRLVLTLKALVRARTWDGDNRLEEADDT